MRVSGTMYRWRSSRLGSGTSTGTAYPASARRACRLIVKSIRYERGSDTAAASEDRGCPAPKLTPGEWCHSSGGRPPCDSHNGSVFVQSDDSTGVLRNDLKTA